MEIIANEGYWITQKHLSDEWERGFWKRLYPAESLAEDDFEQWSDEQKAQWEAEHPADQQGADEISEGEALDIITGGTE